jgi:hypothetical protein
MARKLFDKYALPAVLQARIERATAAVHALDRASFLQPTLAGVLEQIVADNALDVATISKPHSGKAGVSGFMDVAINYRGDGSTFDIYPSRSSKCTTARSLSVFAKVMVQHNNGSMSS